MNLDLNFNGLTKLKDWWQKVLSNFSIIETECTETRNIAENACTKEQAQTYVAEFAGSSEEYMEAIEAFTALYNQSGASLSALEALVGARLPYTEETSLDADEVTGNGVYVCASGAQNTPTSSGVLISFTDTLSDGFQVWFDSDGTGIYRRITGGSWEKADKALTERVAALETAAAQKSEVVFGTYKGDGEPSKIINIGFRPKAVEVYENTGKQTGLGTDNHFYGGFAIDGYPCGDRSNNGIEIVDNGFKVFKNENYWLNTDDSYRTYYFIAYKTGQIVEV